jgi:hypothetical protein
MANILNDRQQPSAGQRHIVPYIAAGMIGLASAGLIGRTWQPAAPAPAASLPQAISNFDAGALTPAAAAFKTMADAGNPHAAYWYGHALDRGLGIPADPKAAIAQYANTRVP